MDTSVGSGCFERPRFSSPRCRQNSLSPSVYQQRNGLQLASGTREGKPSVMKRCFSAREVEDSTMQAERSAYLMPGALDQASSHLETRTHQSFSSSARMIQASNLA